MVDELYAKILGTQQVNQQAFGIPLRRMNTPVTPVHTAVRTALLEQSPDSVFIGFRLYHLHKIIRSSSLRHLLTFPTSLDLPLSQNLVFDYPTGISFEGASPADYQVVHQGAQATNIVHWRFWLDGDDSGVITWDPYTNVIYEIPATYLVQLGSSGYAVQLISQEIKTRKEHLVINNPYVGNCATILANLSKDPDMVNQVLAASPDMAEAYGRAGCVEDKLAAFLLSYNAFV